RIFYRLPSFPPWAWPLFSCTWPAGTAPGANTTNRLASEVKAYSAEMGSTVQKTALDRAVFDCQEKFQTSLLSIVLAMLDPLSLSYSFDVAAARLRNATLMLAYEICQLVLMYNQTAREMSSMIGSSFQFWLTLCCYESNIICSLLQRHCLHTASRLDQTEYTVYQSLIRRFRRKRVFVRAFLLNVSYNMCHKTLLRSLFALRAKEGCDQVAAGITCHYGSLPVVDFLSACWLGGVKVVATAHAATRSRMMRSFVELCLIGQRWAHMTRWRRQNGLILFRGCRLIDLQIYVYNLLSPGATLLFCLDNLPLDPSVLKVQFANYLILDLRFMIFLNATLLGLTFRRLSRSSHAAWLRRNCSKKIRLRPVINVGQRIVDHEVLHLADSDAFYPTIVGLTWCLGRSGQLPLAVLKSPYYCIGDLASVNFARRISSGLVNWVAHLLSAARASLQSLPLLLLLLREIRVSARRLSKKCSNSSNTAAADASCFNRRNCATMSIAEQLVREKYTRRETELVLSSLAEAGLRQRLIDGSRRTFSVSLSVQRTSIQL
uniref:ANK_REP_REGION domain-containing protein n=1 Tax=Macrostomum lignano TaxID=282301 RepID=A0A1I8F9D0_9PLAT